jgi:class 3 adenylate cyclase/tetratricopeptide (TPR) repeat protein
MDCWSCSARLPAEARFCPHCGIAAPAGPTATEERKVVTVLFCDMADSTALSGLLDPELLRAVLMRYFAVMKDLVEARGGIVEKFIGDAVMAVFGLSATHEDDARVALATALDMLEALSTLNDDLDRRHGIRIRVRIGVHTGEVVTTADPSRKQALVSGEVVNIAARLQAVAGADEILISSDARRAADDGVATEDVGPLVLKGITKPVEVFRLLALPLAELRTPRRFDVPFVGRERYLGVLDLTWRQVTEAGDSYLLTILGEAGIGKTRLATEWLARRRDADGQIGLVGMGRCRARGEGGSLGALAECMRTLVEHVESGVPDAARSAGLNGGDAASAGSADISRDSGGPVDAARLGPAIAVLRGGLLADGTPSPSPSETCSAITYVLTALALEHSVVLVLDDCHWADQMLLNLLGRLAGELDRLPIMFLCLARPNLLGTYPSWGTGRANATTITISGLSAAESELLAASYADVAAHDGSAFREIVVQANGNPFYLEQLVTAVCQDGGAVDKLPPGLQALHAARIDQLGEDERLALRHASVLDREFDAEDLRRLAGEDYRQQDYDSILRALARHRLVEPMHARLRERTAYRFVSSLTQRVAYDGLTKRRRGELHERYAEYLAGRVSSNADVGGHLARAYENLAAVGGIDEHTSALRRRAADCLAAAGAAALCRIDLPWASALLTQALNLAEAGDPARPKCLQQLGEAQLTLGRFDEATATLLQAADEADQHGNRAVSAHARLQLAISSGEGAALEVVASETHDIFASCDDRLGLARSCLILAAARHQHGRYAEALDLLGPALAHSESAAADRELANTLGATGLALWLGPVPVSAAIEQCEQLMRMHGAGGHAVQATLGFPLTMLYAIQGQDAAAGKCRDATQQAMAALSYAEAKVFMPLLDALVMLADTEARPQAGPLAETAHRAALDPLHTALRAARAMRLDRLVLLVSLETARVRLQLGEWARAEEAAAAVPAGSVTPAELAAQLGIRARLAARRGEADMAMRLASRAVRSASRTDSPAVQGLAFLDKALTSAAVGRDRAARAAARAAEQCYTAKGHLAGLAQTRRLLREHMP